MENRYSRNRIYVTSEEQDAIKNMPLLFSGSGIGSVIAECALRFGFENITIIDGDQVERTNLNRQNYLETDVTTDKALAIKNRLLAINSKATIEVHNVYLTSANVASFIEGKKIAINALDFTTELPLLFDQICQDQGIPVLHPYNLGWEALVTVIQPNGLSLKTIERVGKNINEVAVVEYVSSYMKFWGKPQTWLEEIIEKYKSEKEKIAPPQLSIASWMVAGMCTHLLYKIATQKSVKKFPEFYLSTLS